MSVGIATHNGWDEDAEANQLLKRADDALYRAKQQGRNQVQSG
jgi:diguanylate cyclase (GGDEF)-like protein